ncbi:MAG: hypothetical protein JWQ89_3561 [Devosia sp.]|uniref:hypothetical protein n=1 Tax=Devosia sp. TaxID=1871048 RepID=UPI002603E1F7|nr:hypothetical protein [Devosia sp.]MDB5541834.1 hypothetical protein [Devosia sp.]
MSVESASYISDLNASAPGSTDLKAEGDDHLRLLKSVLKTTFPAFSGPLTPTHTVLNSLATGNFPNVPLTGITGITSSNKVSITKTGSTYSNVLQLESAGNNSGDASPAITFSASNVNAAIYSIRLAGFGGRLVLATQPVGGGDPLVAMVIDETGNNYPFNNNAVTSGTSANRWLNTYSVAGNFSGAVVGATFNGYLGSGNISQFTNNAGYITGAGTAANANAVPWTGVTGRPTALSQFTNDLSASPVSSVFGRTGAVSLTSGDVTGALGFTPYSTANPSGFINGVSVANATSYTGSDVGAGSDVTGTSLSVSGTTITLTTHRTYRTAPDPGGAG